jgi:alkanesulfonate monooxygenase SsuD/methylene tetrahydromethanopterin reductase-like flavin-dependent oxidoreductase (luciferase family)
VATEICALDNMLAGRRLMLGLGRGSSPREFDAFGVPMAEAKGRFFEAVEIIRLALTQEWFSYSGTFYRIPETTIRPRPRNPQRLITDMRIASSSPAVVPAGANDGLDVIAAAGRIDSRAIASAHSPAEARRDEGQPPLRPAMFAFVACTETDDEGRVLINRHVAEFQEGYARHYQPPADDGPIAEAADAARRMARRLAESLGRETFPETQIWGSPARCLRRLQELHRAFAPAEVITCFKYGSMAYATAEASMRRFAAEVLPVVRAWR